MFFSSLASGSRGNAYLVGDGETCLLLECGLPYKQIQRRSSYTLSNVAACFITHAHTDHAKCADKLLERGLPVYASHGTADALKPLTGFHTLLKDGDKYKPIHIGTMDILPFRTFHDCAEPVGYLIRDKTDKLVFATDTVSLGYTFHGITIAAIECNHDDSILDGIKSIPYKQRAHIVRASNTHMSLSRCCAFLDKLDKSKLREVYLLHMSNSHGDANYFQNKVQQVVGKSIKVVVCKQ